jgi:hypothetical protein
MNRDRLSFALAIVLTPWSSGSVQEDPVVGLHFINIVVLKAEFGILVETKPNFERVVGVADRNHLTVGGFNPVRNILAVVIAHPQVTARLSSQDAQSIRAMLPAQCLRQVPPTPTRQPNVVQLIPGPIELIVIARHHQPRIRRWLYDVTEVVRV